MRYEIKDIINKCKEIPAFICGHGPSLNLYTKKIIDLQNEGYIRFDCNDWFNFIPFTAPNYWCFASSIDTVQKYSEQINRYKSFIIYCDVTDLTKREWIEENIKVNYLPYDNRHLSTNPKCSPEGSCCKRIIPNRLCIQEEVSNRSNHIVNWYGGFNVSSHMIIFALLMGCNPIYIIGCDLDYALGYANKKLIPNMSLDKNAILDDYINIKKFADYLNIKIIQLNKNATYNIFKIGDI